MNGNQEVEKLYQTAREIWEKDERKEFGYGKGIFQIPMRYVAVMPGRIGFLYNRTLDFLPDSSFLAENALVKVFYSPSYIQRYYSLDFDNPLISRLEKLYQWITRKYENIPHKEFVSLSVNISTNRDIARWVDGYDDPVVSLTIEPRDNENHPDRLSGLVFFNRSREKSYKNNESLIGDQIGIVSNRMFGADLPFRGAPANPEDYQAFAFILTQLQPYTGWPYGPSTPSRLV